MLEILVVVAIIALLIAVLMPTLAAARRQSKQLLCQTNLATIAKGWHAYLGDSKGKFLKSVKATDNVQANFGGKQGAIAAYQGPRPLNRYVGLPPVVWSGAELFRCPFDVGFGRELPTSYDYRGNSYHMNHILVGPPGPPGLQVPPGDPCGDVLKRVFERAADLSLSQIKGESRLLLVGDLGWYNAWERSYESADQVNWHTPAGFHNIAFMDGHVRLVKIRKGIHVDDQYTLIPFADLIPPVCEYQTEAKLP
ncbi:MAG: type II secretion system protein [Phycisphaerae bacterium]|nr:type II secretion system protein [Phycisphaerae bacterium]